MRSLNDDIGKNSRNIQWMGKIVFQRREKEPNFILSVFVLSIRMFCVLLFICCAMGIGVVLGVVRVYWETAPALDVAKIENQDQTSFIYDANGNLITDYAGVENRVWASLDEIPVHLQNAFIAMEDQRFRIHNGVDYKRLFGALINNLRNEDVQGGSTITQQLIKNRILSPEKTYRRKVQEAYLAMQLEKYYTKNQILESYLNTIHLGESNYGVKVAAKDYFGKDLDELSLRECATLASITANPYLYNPRKNYYDRNTPQKTDERTNLVLLKMYESGFITKSEYYAALDEKISIKEESDGKQLYDMPYFVEYAINDVITYFLKQRQMDDTSQNRLSIRKEIMTSGYHIYTTVDPEIQHKVEESLYNWRRYPRLRYSQDKTYKVKNPDGNVTDILQPQAAAVVYDYHTGELKAIVGGRVPPSTKRELNRAYQSLMPVGSSIKPLAVYGPAIDKGASPATVVENSPIPIEGWNTEKGYPDNFGGGGFSGPTTLRTGLIKSLNVVAARTLLDYVGLEDSRDYLINLGIDPAHISMNGSGLALGTSGITPIEMAVAYGAIGNKGVYLQPLSFTKVLDSAGKVILDAKEIQQKCQVFKPSTAWLLIDMMKDAVEKGTGSNARISGITVAGKTGTNSDFRGVFFSGITPYYSAAVWIGHDGYKPLYKGAQGGRDAAPLWKDFMSKIHSGLRDKPIIEEEPEQLGLVKASVCAKSGLKPHEGCPIVSDWFLEGTVPEERCPITHIVIPEEEDSEDIEGDNPDEEDHPDEAQDDDELE